MTAGEFQPLSIDETSGGDQATQDVVDLLYRYGVSGILISVLASSGLALVAWWLSHNRLVIGWWLSITIVLALRAADIFFYGKTSLDFTSNPKHPENLKLVRNPRLDLWRFGSGIVATSILWGLFAVLFQRDLDEIGRTFMVIVLCGMVGGSATVLSPSRALATIYA